MTNKEALLLQVSDKMDPNELVKLIEILNPQNKPGRITIITRMGAENMRVKFPHLIRAVRRAGQIVTWVSDPMHGNTINSPVGLKTRSFDSIRVRCSLLHLFYCEGLVADNFIGCADIVICYVSHLLFKIRETLVISEF